MNEQEYKKEVAKIVVVLQKLFFLNKYNESCCNAGMLTLCISMTVRSKLYEKKKFLKAIDDTWDYIEKISNEENK